MHTRYFKFKEWSLTIGGLNFVISFEGKHDDNKHGCDWLEGLREIPDIVPPVIPQRHRPWHAKELGDIKYVSQSLVTRVYHYLIV